MACELFLAERIAKLDLIIAALEDALIALADPTVLSYTLDTGQDSQRVQRNDLSDMIDKLPQLYDLRNMLCARGSGGHVVQVVPIYP